MSLCHNEVMQMFDVYIVVSLNKLLNKQSIYQWFQTSWCPSDCTVMPYTNINGLGFTYCYSLLYSCFCNLYLIHIHCNKHRATSFLHDDVIKWKHFLCNWPFVQGIHQSPVNSPDKGLWHGALMFSLICIWINGRVNNHEAGDLRRYRAHYDVIIMGQPNRNNFLFLKIPHMWSD